MDYLFAKFVDFSLSRFVFIVRTDRHTYRETDRITDRQILLNALLTQLSPA